MDRRNHMMLLDQSRKTPLLADGDALRRIGADARKQMFEVMEEAIEFSPRDTNLLAMHTALRASLKDANEPGGTSAGGRKGGTRGRDDPTSSRADRKRRGRR
jgi:hypothetical protein